jgi:peptidoglycan/xylan/chitin deacetylase (PgdA/CDA1 family)
VPITLAASDLERDLSKDPPTFTAAFDGSLRFSLWLRMLRFSREMKQQHGQAPHFTFFVNGAFYSTDKDPSDVGRATTHAEVLVRRALTQQAINEGHEIGDHGMGHHDGSRWSRAEWDAELDRFHEVMSAAVFEPIVDVEGKPVFPAFAPLEGAAPRDVGAACASAADCDSGLCAALTPEVGVCTAACNLKTKCPKGTACGAPMFREDMDLCLPPPRFPVSLDGQVLFDARGEPNPKHPRLRPYRIVGFRAPYLAANDAMYEALIARDYRFDTSQARSAARPYFFTSSEPGRGRILELALMPWPGARAVPMDYNYRLDKATAERMQADYDAGLVAAYEAGHWPWNIGHHFATWEEGAYVDVLERTVEHALTGCPSPERGPRCPGTVVVSFRELADRLRPKTERAQPQRR